MRYGTLRGETLIHRGALRRAVQVPKQGVQLSQTRCQNVCKGDGVELLTRYPGMIILVQARTFGVGTYAFGRAFRNLSGEGAERSNKVHFYKGHSASHALLETKEVDFRFPVVPL